MCESEDREGDPEVLHSRKEPLRVDSAWSHFGRFGLVFRWKPGEWEGHAGGLRRRRHGASFDETGQASSSFAKHTAALQDRARLSDLSSGDCDAHPSAVCKPRESTSYFGSHFLCVACRSHATAGAATSKSPRCTHLPLAEVNYSEFSQFLVPADESDGPPLSPKAHAKGRGRNGRGLRLVVCNHRALAVPALVGQRGCS